MANYFQLSNGVRVASNQPIDGDRYIVNDINSRDNLISIGRAYNGLQVYVKSVKTLYLLEDISIPKWVILQSSGTSSIIISSPTQLIFNSGGTLTGSSNIIYDYNLSKLIIKDVKSEFSINNSYDDTPTLLLKSNFIDGLEIDIATNLPTGGALSTIRSKGNQTNKINIDSTNLFVYGHAGYFNTSSITAAQISIDTKEWDNHSYATEYSISTISSGNTSIEERFLINKYGAIRFNNAYSFPISSGLTNQTLILSGNGELIWSNINNISGNTLSGLTDTIIMSPKEGDKLIYSGGSWINVTDADMILIENIGSGGTYEFVIGDKNKTNAIFLHFMNYQNSVFQMGELQLLHNNVDAQVTTNGQDLNLYVTYTAKLDGNDIVLICDVPSGLSGDVYMKYTLEIL